ncbi:aldose epimerase [Paenibacillaceae bacterium]|nr:aldose epimerase [Paenibacillaceae bacterium]
MSNFKINVLEDTYTIYELVEESSSSFVRICPERGAIATELTLNGQSLFYLDRDTFLNPDANIRGGNPILFPICGQLNDTQYEWNGQTYTMKNHGVARTAAWEVTATSTDGQASLELRLRSDDTTLASYPFEFELVFTYVLQDGKLRIDQRYCNRSDEAMPVYAGFHPYFNADSKSLVYATDATDYYDYNDEKVKAIEGAIDLNGLVESVALLDAKQPSITFPVSDSCTVTMNYSDIFKYVVLWSVEGKPFVCVEPWMAKTNELNNKTELPIIEAGQELNAWLTIACET